MLEIRYCVWGKSWGYYLDDDLTAEIGGCAIPIAIANDELREAVAQQPKEGPAASVRLVSCQRSTIR